MMGTAELFEQFHEIASSPAAQLRKYTSEGRKAVLTAPVYTPEEIIHSMGAVPMAAWGADIEINDAKKYFPAFICSVMQTILELGIKGTYRGVSAIVIPSLCDSLKCLGENWKYAVPDIPFIPMTYPQNRKPDYAADFLRAGYERVIGDLEKYLGTTFDDASLAESVKVYNEHNAVMREFADCCSRYPGISARQRSDVFKSAGFMLKEEHTALVRELLAALEREPEAASNKHRIVVSGILADSPSLLDIIDENDLQIVWDDVAAQSRQYRTDVPEEGTALDSLIMKFRNMDNCSVLYDVQKKRVDLIPEKALEYGAKGVLIVMTKFCDPEEFDYPLIRKACADKGIYVVMAEVDRQMINYEQARTMIESFAEMIS